MSKNRTDYNQNASCIFGVGLLFRSDSFLDVELLTKNANRSDIHFRYLTAKDSALCAHKRPF